MATNRLSNAVFNKLDRHIVLAIISSTLVVLFALMSIDLLGKIIAEIDILGDKDYHFLRLMAYVLGLVPLKLAEFFPMALLIGALMGLGKIAAHNELTVMQIAGVSRLRIGIIGFLVALILGGIVLLITEFIGVALNQRVTQMRAEALGEVTTHYGHAGVWAQNGNNFINIKGVTADGKLANIHLYTLDDEMQIKQIRYAQTADTGSNEWLLYNVTDKTLHADRIEVRHTAQSTWKNSLDESMMALLLVDPEDLSIRDLYRYIRYQQANGVRPTNYSLAFWQRLFIPLSTGVMFLLSLPFVFGSQRNSNQGRKLFIGVMLGLSYFVCYTSIANIILLTGAPIILGAIIPIALFTAVSFMLLWLRG